MGKNPTQPQLFSCPHCGCKDFQITFDEAWEYRCQIYQKPSSYIVKIKPYSGQLAELDDDATLAYCVNCKNVVHLSPPATTIWANRLRADQKKNGD